MELDRGPTRIAALRGREGVRRLAGTGLADELVEDSRARLARPLAGRERLTAVAAVGLFLVAAALLATLADSGRELSPALLATLLVAFAVASRVELEVGAASVVPTGVVFVPMLFLLPTETVPLYVAAGYLLGGLPELVSRRLHVQRTLVLVASAWYALGPALVVALLAPGTPSWSSTPVYLLALATQLALDGVNALARDGVGLGLPTRLLVAPLTWAFAIDALLAPMGLMAAMASVEHRFAFLAVLPVVALIAIFAADRRRRIDESLVLTEAYRDANQEARSDPLTGLGNRLAWEEALAAAQAGLAVHDAPTSILLVDLDRLKEANDRHGHDAGDRLLQTAAGLLREALGSGPPLARIGGDEFGAVLPGTAEAGCLELVDRIEAAARARSDIRGFPLSLSVGHASCPPEATLYDALRTADVRLYGAKTRERARAVGPRRQRPPAA